MSSVDNHDLDILKSYLSSDHPMPKSELQFVSKYVKKRSYKKGDYILNYMDVEKKVAFLVDGIVHQYNLIDGDILTINIALPGTTFNSFISYVQETPSQQIQEVIKDVTMLYLEKRDLELCAKSCPNFCYILLNKHEQFHLRREKRTFILQHKSAVKRFELFMEDKDVSTQYWNYVPQRLIASYLGLTPESLSRAKRRHTTI